MKRHLLALFFVILFISCSGSKKELYEETDKFVVSLSTDYQSYGLLGGSEYTKTTTDELYKITPIGRLINVKIMKVADDNEYEDLRKDLDNHYKDDARANSVYICKAGTVMIDCRN